MHLNAYLLKSSFGGTILIGHCHANVVVLCGCLVVEKKIEFESEVNFNFKFIKLLNKT